MIRRRSLPLPLLALSGLLVLMAQAEARMVCTVLADARSGNILVEDGDCRTRVTPASTFKIALAVMGHDAGFLKDETTPALPFVEGYPDWGGANWRRTTTPARWMTHSVVWYSQRIAHALGVERLAAYTSAFGYGNSDWAGDPGKDNALDRAWISSSLKIAPVEQVGFLGRLLRQELPVKNDSVAFLETIIDRRDVDGWQVRGKTGSAYPRRKDGSFDRARGWGWFVGWAARGDETVAFARLDQDESRHQTSAGIRTRDAFLAAWPALSGRATK